MAANEERARELLAAEINPRSALERKWLESPEDGCDVLIPAKDAVRAIEAALASQPPAAAGEREGLIEECAKVADGLAEVGNRGGDHSYALGCEDVADRIRALGSPFVDCAGEDGR